MFCTRIRGQLKSLLSQFDTYVDGHIDTALQIATALKNVLSSPVADIITEIIPGSLDDTIREDLITALNKAITVLTMADNCKQYTALNDILNCFVQQLKLVDPQLQDTILLKLASLVAGILDGNRLDQNYYDLYTQAKYVAAQVKS